MKNKFYITTAIDYVNAEPHIGHAYQKIVADALARWHKVKGDRVFYLTGTDEHGQKISESAQGQGLKEKAFVDKMSKKFKEAWKLLDVNFDRFIRTTDKDHEEFVKKFTEKVKKDIYKGTYSGLYCVGCERFYTEKDLNNGECVLHPGKKLDPIKEETYFFNLSKYQEKLLKYYKDHENFILPKERRNEIINRVKEGLQDLSITRKNLKWGIPFPLDKDHVFYVWFEALLNYLSGSGKKQEFWPADVHLLGRDNGWFHAVIWPAMLLSAGYKLPKTVFIHGFLTFNGNKISKSLGNAISPNTLVEKYGVDAIRYYVLRNFVFGEDGDFSESALKDRHNNELANKLGNLVSRVAGLIEKNKNSREKREKKVVDKINIKTIENFVEKGAELSIVLEHPGEEIERRVYSLSIRNHRGSEGLVLSRDLWLFSEAVTRLVNKKMENYQFDKALNDIFTLIDYCNWYVQANKIWETKDKKSLYELKESILKIAELLWPFIPRSAEKIKKQFSEKNIKKGEILFRKLE